MKETILVSCHNLNEKIVQNHKVVIIWQNIFDHIYIHYTEHYTTMNV